MTLESRHFLSINYAPSPLDAIHLQLNDYTTFLTQYSGSLLEPQNNLDSHLLRLQLEVDEEEEQEEEQEAEHEAEIMSNQQSTFHSQSYSSATFSSSSNGEAAKTWRRTESSSSNPQGTTVHKTSEEPGQTPVEETLRYDSSGKAIQESNEAGRIEDVTDADRQYLERMEDEYAKREGGS
jgi:hypothetical protein